MVFKKGEISNPRGNPNIAQISKLCSTGPKTLEGKRQSSQNALKHGYYSRENNIKNKMCISCPHNCAFKIDFYDGCPLNDEIQSIKQRKTNLNSVSYSELDCVIHELNKILSQTGVGLYNFHNSLELDKTLINKVFEDHAEGKEIILNKK